jgi:hypothetical protein
MNEPLKASCDVRRTISITWAIGTRHPATVHRPRAVNRVVLAYAASATTRAVPVVRPATGSGTLLRLDNIESGFVSPGSKSTIAVDATYFRSGLLGSHELQIGTPLQPTTAGSSTTIRRWPA